jgi:hypothetical protein
MQHISRTHLETQKQTREQPQTDPSRPASSYWAPPAFEAHQGHHHHHQHPQRHDPLPAMQAPPYHGSPSSSPPPPPRGPPFMNAYPPQQYATSVTSSGSEPQHSHDEADLKRCVVLFPLPLSVLSAESRSRSPAGREKEELTSSTDSQTPEHGG